MASLLDDAGRRFQAAAMARRRSLRQADEDRGVDRAEAQRAFEERIAREDAERERRRGPTVPAEELARREDERRATVAVLRDLRTTIEVERHDLNAALVRAVEIGDIEAAIAAVMRQQALGPVAGVAAQRLAALGIKVQT